MDPTVQTQRGAGPGPELVAPALMPEGRAPFGLPLQPSQPAQGGAGAALGQYSTGWLAGSPPRGLGALHLRPPSFPPTQLCGVPLMRQAPQGPRQTVPALGGGGTVVLCQAVSFSWAQPCSTSSTCLISFILMTPSEAGPVIMPTLRMRSRVRGSTASASCRHRTEVRQSRG